MTYTRHLHPNWVGFGITVAVLLLLAAGGTLLMWRRRGRARVPLDQ